MKQVIEIIEQIKNTTKRKEKETILKENSSNELLKKVLYYTYNPFLTYGIGEKSLVDLKYRLDITTDYNDIFELLDSLSSLRGVNDEIKTKAISYIYNRDTVEEFDLYVRMISKNLRIGISTKTINKIFNNLIPEFNLQLAYNYFEHTNFVNGKGFTVTKKLDGIRCGLVKSDSHTAPHSREGIQFYGLTNIEQELSALPNNFLYDGELLYSTDEKMPSKTLYRKTMSELMAEKDNKNIKFVMFDAIPYEEFLTGKSKEPYVKRREFMENIFKNSNYKFIELLPVLYHGEDETIIPQLLDKIKSEEEEGLMINIDEGLYECKRTKNILKVKDVQEADLRVVGFEAGQGKHEGVLGSLIVEYKNNTVNVGTGLTDAMRKEIWDNKDLYLDKIVKVEFFEESNNQDNDLVSMRFPRFAEWRFDKSEPNYY